MGGRRCELLLQPTPPSVSPQLLKKPRVAFESGLKHILSSFTRPLVHQASQSLIITRQLCGPESASTAGQEGYRGE